MLETGTCLRKSGGENFFKQIYGSASSTVSLRLQRKLIAKVARGLRSLSCSEREEKAAAALRGDESQRERTEG